VSGVRGHGPHNGTGSDLTKFGSEALIALMLIVEDPTVTEMKNSNKSAVSLLKFLCKSNVGESLTFTFIHIISY
jgi:hypothetical protein